MPGRVFHQQKGGADNAEVQSTEFKLRTWKVALSLDPRPSDLCILMEGLVRDDHMAYNLHRTDLIGRG